LAQFSQRKTVRYSPTGRQKCNAELIFKRRTKIFTSFILLDEKEKPATVKRDIGASGEASGQ
jgi:hypothetical protein